MQQLGFDLDYTDPISQELVPWQPYCASLIEDIANAPWKICDLETTGLNPASPEINFTAKDLRRGVNPRLRLRICSILIPSRTKAHTKPYEEFAFDFDTLTQTQQKAVATAAYSKVFINHNAGFDAYWLAILASSTPDLILDSMLIARVLRPNQPIILASMCEDPNIDAEISLAAQQSFIESRSGWSLADLMLSCFHEKLDKSNQGPRNWAEPFLPKKSWDYATGDTISVLRLICFLFQINISDLSSNPHLLLTTYEKLKQTHKPLRIIEPQVLDVVQMRLKGMPWDPNVAQAYIRSQKQKVQTLANELVSLIPELKPHLFDLSQLDKGITDTLKQILGQAFTAAGLELETTTKTGAFKVGEKDLRKVKAAILNDRSKLLFSTWSSLNRAKKAAGMAQEVSKYAIRSGDNRLHPNTGHGPLTGRLSSSEPNCQQFPRDQGFRNGVTAAPNHKIVASDYSALDMRVGAALAIRAQLHILEVYYGKRTIKDKEAIQSIHRVMSGKITSQQAKLNEKNYEEKMLKLRQSLDPTLEPTKSYWEQYRQIKRAILLSSFEYCLARVQEKCKEKNTTTWGSLRDAFSIPGMDIHTWTALAMTGKDPIAIFGHLSNDDVAITLKKHKKELGDLRQTGKVGNLSLLYAMQTLGLMDAAAKNYNIHWSFAEADKVRRDWLESYVEIDLWHKWTALNPHTRVRIPDPDRGGKFASKDVYASYTLGDRLIYAFGLNAALSYEDQSTGADILGRVMETLRIHHPHIFQCTINQVHDELVYEIPDEHVASYTATIEAVMVECANHFLMPFGIPGECSPAIGQVWLKD